MSGTHGTVSEGDPVDDRTRRAEQQGRLALLREQLEAEGASGDVHLSELLFRVNAWPE